MQVKQVGQLPSVTVPEPYHRELRTLYSPEQDPDLAGDLTLFHCRIFPHAGTDFHRHEKSGEIMYVLEGSGQAVMEDGTVPLAPGTALYSPPGERHQIKNTGDSVMVLLTLFSPAVGTAYAKGKAKEVS